jgi:CDP-diacylglycerol---serine O-phosphatidyltransferase
MTNTLQDVAELRGHVNVANLVTTASLVAGVAALLEVLASGPPVSPFHLRAAAGLIALAAALDGLDGPLARRFGTVGEFGAMLDSLTDMAAGGITPVALVYAGALYRVPLAATLGCGSFAAAAAWRLARFMLAKHRLWFTGCPVPVAATLLACAVLANTSFVWLLTVTVALSLAMVGAFPFPTWAALHLRLRRRVAAPLPSELVTAASQQ